MHNLYSFKETESLSFESPKAVLVGPNNSGKSNVFKLLHLLIDELNLPRTNMYPSRIYSDQNRPCLNVKLSLNREETNSVVGSKDNFPKYRRLMKAFEIPSILMADKTRPKNVRMQKFLDHTLPLPKNGIKGRYP